MYNDLITGDYKELKVSSKHCFVLETLPFIHNDPFDRLLISQAMSEELILITHDKDILKYDTIKRLQA